MVHYHELALKGKNRPFFIRRLERNLLRATRSAGVERVIRLPGRLLLTLGRSHEWKTISERLEKVFGVANFSPAFQLPVDLAAIPQAVGPLVESYRFESFRVKARRADKSLPFRSMDVNVQVGAYIQGKTGRRVDLDGADLTIHIELLKDCAFCYFERFPGPGGLPVGVSGRVMVLLSGGIDSPVAAFRMMRRGAYPIYVHFHSHPFLSRASQEKAWDLVQVLAQYQYRARLYLVPFGELQREVVLRCPKALRVVIYRRLMMRIAEAVARRCSAQCLVTGESLGQVASQTIENMAVIQQAVALPVLRPLIGMDKEEIVQQSKAIGAYEISTIPDQDCCQLFVPKHPAIRSRLDEVVLAEQGLDIPAMVRVALEKLESKIAVFP